MKNAELTPERREELRKRALHFAGDCDVLCLHALAQPLVGEMQAAIRYQQAVIELQSEAINHVLQRIRYSHEVAHTLGAATETYQLLTEAYAEAGDYNVDALRDEILPGSACIHRRRPTDGRDE
jgi:hypothetical protein